MKGDNYAMLQELKTMLQEITLAFILICYITIGRFSIMIGDSIIFDIFQAVLCLVGSLLITKLVKEERK